MTPANDDNADAIAARLDRLRDLPDEMLAELVERRSTCVWLYACGDVPAWTGEDTADRELAARLCAGCPVQDECLEVELRTAGEATTGVWGALPEDDRRAAHRAWRERRSDEQDGARP